MRADLESCRSGRTGRIRNPLYPQGYPGFESLALRQMKKTQPRLGFFVSGERAERASFVYDFRNHALVIQCTILPAPLPTMHSLKLYAVAVAVAFVLACMPTLVAAECRSFTSRSTLRVRKCAGLVRTEGGAPTGAKPV